jgi:hypothetical protein
MKHLLPTTDIQSIKIIPRVYSTSVTMDLRDDSTNTTVSITPTATKVGNYIQLSNVFDLKEGRFYDLKVIETSTQNIIYRDKIFCTSQSTDQTNNESYSVNKDEYKSKSGNNDFIIL